MCNFLTQIIMPSFLSHFPILYAFFFQQKPQIQLLRLAHIF
jgi:hypothetical protein